MPRPGWGRSGWGRRPGSARSGSWPRSTVLQLTGGGSGQIEGVVEFAVGQESGIAGDVGPVEFEAEAAIELGSKWLCLAVTHQRSLSGWQETSENPGKPG